MAPFIKNNLADIVVGQIITFYLIKRIIYPDTSSA